MWEAAPDAAFVVVAKADIAAVASDHTATVGTVGASASSGVVQPCLWTELCFLRKRRQKKSKINFTKSPDVNQIGSKVPWTDKCKGNTIQEDRQFLKDIILKAHNQALPKQFKKKNHNRSV